jgi:hypothetical protein
MQFEWKPIHDKESHLMLKAILAASVFACIAATGALGTVAAQASEPAVAPLASPEQSVKIVPAGVVIVYNARLHGPRCRFRGPYCGYYYGGWWYGRPWWRMAPPVFVRPPLVGPGYWVYNPYRHGVRCRFRGPRCGYFYRGYWYARPFWSIRIN